MNHMKDTASHELEICARDTFYTYEALSLLIQRTSLLHLSSDMCEGLEAWVRAGESHWKHTPPRRNSIDISASPVK